MAGHEDKAGAAPLADLLCFSVYATGLAFNRLYRPLLEPMGLTYPQYLVMQLLWAGDGCAVKEIGRTLKLESNTLTPLLKRLEGMGLIARRRDGADERVVRIALTPKGQALRPEAAEVVRCVADVIGMDEDELGDLSRTLARLRDRLAAAAERTGD
ncbi:MAG: MarR family transcriptional regulator [Acuticoccus sp.]